MSQRIPIFKPRRQVVTPLSYIDGLVMSQDTDTDHDIQLGVGEATFVDSGSNGERILGTLDTVITKQIDAVWAAGDDAGGRASAVTLTTATWYHFFALSDGEGRVDAGFDTSLTAANLLADATNFGFYRRVGSVLTDGSSNITAFTQFGDWFLWNTIPLDVDVVNVGATTIQTAAISVPTGINVMAYLNVAIAENAFYVKSPAAADVQIASIGSTGKIPATEITDAGHVWVITDTSAQINYRTSLTTADISIGTAMWIDPRGRTIT